VEKQKLEKYCEGLHKGKEDIIPVLQNIQADLNYLPEDLLRSVAEYFDVPLINVYSIATFYKAFSLEPRGKYLVSICMGTACHVRHSPRILDEIKRILEINPGETTEDKLFSLETVNCLGACALGPIVVVNEEYHGQMTVKKAQKLLEGYKEKEMVA
jgi:NADH-quinone oxidoreductase subunit E